MKTNKQTNWTRTEPLPPPPHQTGPNIKHTHSLTLQHIHQSIISLASPYFTLDDLFCTPSGSSMHTSILKSLHTQARTCLVGFLSSQFDTEARKKRKRESALRNEVNGICMCLFYTCIRYSSNAVVYVWINWTDPHGKRPRAYVYER